MNEVQRLRLRATFHTLPLYLFYPVENYTTLEIHPYARTRTRNPYPYP